MEEEGSPEPKSWGHMAEPETLTYLPCRRGISKDRCVAAMRPLQAEKEREKYFGFSLFLSPQHSTSASHWLYLSQGQLARQLENVAPCHRVEQW